MKDKKYILGLDVSTSTIGICLYEDLGNEGKLCVLTHFEPKISPAPETELEKLMGKADVCIEMIVLDFARYNITRIIVEKPLFNSINQKTAKILEMFNQYLTHKLGKFFDLEIDFVTVHNARKYGLPELLGKNGKMMSDFPKLVAGLKKSAWSKFLIMYLVSQRYPDIVWLLNNNLKINKKNFDRADSIVVVLGFMAQSNYWSNMTEELGFWTGANLSYDRCVEVIEKNVAYEKFSKDHVDRNKEYTVDEKRVAKRKYLNEEFRIKDFINVEY